MVNAAREQHKIMRQTPEAFLHATQALTATCNGRTLRILAHSATAHEDARMVMESGVFHQHLLKDVCTISQLGFLEARKIRNAQDWARGRAIETRDALAAVVVEKPPSGITFDEVECR
jgi:hypothetical protein